MKNEECIYCYIESDRKTHKCEIDGKIVTENTCEGCKCFSRNFEEKIIG